MQAGFPVLAGRAGEHRDPARPGSARGVVPFLQEAPALLSEGLWLRTVRADSGFFDEPRLAFLEGRGLPHVIVARMTSTLKRKRAGIQEWTLIDEPHDASEFAVQLFGWPLRE